MNVRTVIDARKETQSRVVEEVANVIFDGGTAIFPTDTVYGIGCDPYNVRAVSSVYGAKQRPGNKPLTLHLATLSEFLEYARENAAAANAGRALMPGPVSIIVRRPTFIEPDVTAGLATLGFRVPDDLLCAAILERCGPLAATSANMSGGSPYVGDGDAALLPAADLLVEAGPTKYRRESSIIDMSGSQAVLLREGVISAERLTALLGTQLTPKLVR